MKKIILFLIAINLVLSSPVKGFSLVESRGLGQESLSYQGDLSIDVKNGEPVFTHEADENNKAEVLNKTKFTGVSGLIFGSQLSIFLHIAEGSDCGNCWKYSLIKDIPQRN